MPKYQKSPLGSIGKIAEIVHDHSLGFCAHYCITVFNIIAFKIFGGAPLIVDKLH